MSKVWFITGAGSGIGAATARAALNAGDRVVATGRNVEKLRHALREVAGARPQADALRRPPPEGVEEPSGGRAVPQENLEVLRLDVSDEMQAMAAIERAVRRYGRIDVVVNSAGYSLLGNYEELGTQDIERLFATNFWGVSHVMRAALPVMRKQRSGHLVNISSVAGAVGLMHCGAYSASKFAVEGLSLAVAEEVAKFGIKVTVVEPGFFRTDLLDATNARWPSQRIADYAAAEVSAEAMWSAYDGMQPGDPDRLGQVLVQLTDMVTPPRVFVAGSDALAVIAPAVEARLKAVHAFEDLSKSTDGSF